jgi:uridine phosphorylase
MSYGRAIEPVDEAGRYYHLRCRPGDLAPCVLLPGDPARVARISRHWDEAREVASYRHYVTHTGSIGAVPVSAVSTGTGNASMAMVVEEAARLGAQVLIRVGTCGAIQPGIALGDVVITTASVRLDGATATYVRPEYPAAAHYEVVLALVEAAEALGVRYHLGVTASTDSWYVGQGRPGFGGYFPSHARALIEDLRAARVVNFEMDSSALLTLAGLFGLRAGAVCAVYANRVEDTFAMEGEDRAIAVANRAVTVLHAMDEQRARRGRRYWSVGLAVPPAPADR